MRVVLQILEDGTRRSVAEDIPLAVPRLAQHNTLQPAAEDFGTAKSVVSTARLVFLPHSGQPQQTGQSAHQNRVLQHPQHGVKSCPPQITALTQPILPRQHPPPGIPATPLAQRLAGQPSLNNDLLVTRHYMTFLVEVFWFSRFSRFFVFL